MMQLGIFYITPYSLLMLLHIFPVTLVDLGFLCFEFVSCSEVDEIHKICSIIGSPNQNSWAEGLQLAEAMKYQFPQVVYCFLLHAS